MERQDWQGCIRETHRHPRSARLLGTRINCALQAGDQSERRRACAEIRQHYPQHPYVRMCDSLDRAYGP
jgi:hypothetical protein